MDVIGKYRIEKFPSSRLGSLDILHEGKQKHHVTALIETDVTIARDRLKELSEREGEKVSFTGWLIHCIGQAAARFPESHAAMKGNKIYVFEDVDVSMIIERDVGGKRVPLPYIVRRANMKTVLQIHREIRAVQHEPGNVVALGSESDQKRMRLYTKLPRWIRRAFWRSLRGNALAIKKNMGTVVVTAIGMFGKGAAWPIPIGIHPLEIAVGSIFEKPWGVNGTIALRDILHLTVMLDHDVIDGAPAARFLSHLNELISTGFGLDPTTKG